MENILVPEVCALAIGRLPIVGRPKWRLTEGKHIVKLEITWQLPRTSPQRKPTNKTSAKQDDARVKMAVPKMAAPTPPRSAASFNDAVCLTPSSTTEERRAPQQQEERPSTPITATDLETTTDRSPPGEWKEVVSKKKKKILRASTPKKESPAPLRRRTPPMERRRTPPLEQPRKIQRTTAPRTSPAPAHSRSSLHAVANTEIETGRGRMFSFWLWQVIPHS